MENRKQEVFAGAKEGTLIYSNQMHEIPLSALTAAEAKIFLACCYSYQRKNREYFRRKEPTGFEKKARRLACEACFPVTEISFRDLKVLSGYKGKNAKRFVEDLRKMRMRLQAVAVERELPSSTETEKDTQRFIVFPIIEIFETEKKMTFTGNARFIRYLFGLDKNYTEIEMKEVMSLKSIYSIILYGRLRQWRSTGRWVVNYDAFKRIMGTQGTAYTQTNINKRIITPALQELSPLFSELTLTRIRDEKRKGRPLRTLLFTFRPEKKKSASFPCPRCGRPLYEKEIGGKICWCHPDGWKKDAPCSAIFDSVAQVMGYSEVPGREEPALAESIAERLSGMFRMED